MDESQGCLGYAGLADGPMQSLDGEPGAVSMTGGKIRVAYCFTIRSMQIAAIDLVASPEILARMDIVLL